MYMSKHAANKKNYKLSYTSIDCQNFNDCGVWDVGRFLWRRRGVTWPGCGSRGADETGGVDGSGGIGETGSAAIQLGDAVERRCDAAVHIGGTTLELDGVSPDLDVVGAMHWRGIDWISWDEFDRNEVTWGADDAICKDCGFLSDGDAEWEKEGAMCELSGTTWEEEAMWEVEEIIWEFDGVV